MLQSPQYAPTIRLITANQPLYLSFINSPLMAAAFADPTGAPLLNIYRNGATAAILAMQLTAAERHHSIQNLLKSKTLPLALQNMLEWLRLEHSPAGTQYVLAIFGSPIYRSVLGYPQTAQLLAASPS